MMLARTAVVLASLLLTLDIADAYNVCGAGSYTFSNDPNKNNCQMGWSTQHASGAATGGEGAASTSIYTVTTRAQLWTALANNKTPKDKARIVYISGTIRGDDLGNGLYADQAYYRTYPVACEFYHDLYLQSFNDTYMTALAKSDPTKYALALQQGSLLETYQSNIQEQIMLKVPANTSIIGLGSTALIQGVWLRIKAASNVVIRNIEMEAVRDWSTKWSSSDGFNAEFDVVTVEKSTRVWLDHLTLSDGRYPDEEAGWFKGHQIQYHDGLLDIKSESDFVTVSHCIFANHSKTTILGYSDSATEDTGLLKTTFYANLYKNNVQRMPRVRYGKVHVLSNYFIASAKTTYFIGMGVSSSIFSEANVFEAPSATMLVNNFYGYTFNDVGSWLNGTSCSSDIVAAAKSKASSSFTTTLGWTVPYEYEAPSSYASAKALVLNNAGAGKIGSSSDTTTTTSSSEGTTACVTTKNCGSQKCGSLWDGCYTVVCGTCPSTSVCNGTQCISSNSGSNTTNTSSTTLDTIDEWQQVIPDSQTTANWGVTNSTLYLKTYGSTTRMISYLGAKTTWYSDSSTTVSVNVVASEGVVGIGMRFGQGTGRTTDRLEWLLTISGTKATAQFCRTQYGTEKCVTGKTITWDTKGSNNLTINTVVGSKYINVLGYLGTKKLSSSAMTVGASNFSSVGKLFLIAKGTAAKSFGGLTVRSNTAVHVALTTCMTTSAWNSFVTKLLGIATVDSRSVGDDAKCAKRRAAGEAVFSEFETMIPDDIITDTPSKAMASLLQDSAINEGVAASEGIEISSLTTTTPTVAAEFLVDGAVATSAALSTGAIIGIAVGCGVGGLAVVGAATAGVVVAVKKSRNTDNSSELQKPSTLPSAGIKANVVKGGVNVMDPETGDHASITNRAAPAAY